MCLYPGVHLIFIVSPLVCRCYILPVILHVTPCEFKKGDKSETYRVALPANVPICLMLAYVLGL